MRDDYKPLETTEHMERCPVCAGTPSLWQYSEADDKPVSKVVMCTHGEPIGPQDGLTNEGCPMFMPPDHHYRATIREAIKYWNDFAKALSTLRRKNAWEHAQVLRATASAAQQAEQGRADRG